ALSPHFAFVAAVGAHDDLARVLRFFADNRIERPDGTTMELAAHDYGALVLVYSHIESFFAADDLPAPRDALRLWTWDDKEGARRRARDLSQPAQARMQALFDRNIDAVKTEMVAEIERSRAAEAAVSPRGHLKDIRVPVFLLHGAGDTVIPSTE